MKYNIGDKVVIIDERRFEMNDSGKMDKYLGDTLTIRHITDMGLYKMEEDYGENNGKGWFWGDRMIDHEKTAELHSKEDEDLFQEIDETLKSIKQNLDNLQKAFQEEGDSIDNEKVKEVEKTPLEFRDKVKIDIENSIYTGFQSDIGRIIEQHISKEGYWVATSMVYGADILLCHLEEFKYIG